MFSLRPIPILLLALIFTQSLQAEEQSGVREFCLSGFYDLGARYQGLHMQPGEPAATRWCVVTEDHSGRVRFSIDGKSNPDMAESFTVAYMPPALVRIVNADSPPDIDFNDADMTAEALRYRRLDPRRLVAELDTQSDWVEQSACEGWLQVSYPGSDHPVRIHIADGRLRALHTYGDFPLRGRVPVVWQWRWPDSETPGSGADDRR